MALCEDDLAPPASAYFPREEPRFDERDGRHAWREPDSLGVAIRVLAPIGNVSTDYSYSLHLQMGYGSGLSGADRSGVTSGHLGLSGHGSLNLGLSTHDDLGLLGQGQMLGVDKSSTIGRNEYLPRQENPLPRTGAPGLLPSDASPTLFVEGLPSDCSKREASRILLI